MRRIVYILCLLLVITSCNGQVNQDSTKEIFEEKYDDLINPDPEMPRLSTTNYVETLSPLVRRYANESLYYLYVRNDMCTYQILVNDMLRYSRFKYEKVITPHIINTSILRSGNQKLTVRIYPIGEFGDVDYTTFPDFTSLGLTLYCRNYQTGFNDEKVVLEYQSPTKKNGEGQDVFIGAGENYYEINLYFEAEVPYVHKGWSDGQDLRRLNQKKLEKEVLRFFHKQWLIFGDRDWEAWYSYLYRKELEVTASLYHSKEDLRERVEEDEPILLFKDYEIQPMDDFVLTFYGYGKVVRLEQTNPDPFYRGESSIMAEYIDKEGYECVFYQNIYIYLPEGRELKAENFVIIR